MSSVTAASLAAPTILHLPPDVVSSAAAVEAIEWGEAYGLTLDADQHATLHAALGERADGTWAAAEVGDFKGRQAGKNDTLKVRQGAGIDLFGERLIIHTAHEFATANEDFLRLVAVYEAFDDLRKSVARVRYANGEQGIEFVNGARIKYRARTGGAGRGFSEADMVVYDEAQHLQPEHLAASLPTMLVNPNFQAWYCGSGGFTTSAAAWMLRRRALSNDGGRFAYTENTAQRVSLEHGELLMSVPDDLLDEDVLLTHPGYANGRVSFETMETMHRGLGPERFAREILCVWEPPPDSDAEGPVPYSRWVEMTDGESVPADDAPVRLAMDVPPDRTRATFAIAGKRADGLLHVGVRYDVPATMMRDLVRLAKTLTEGHGCPLILPPNSPAKAWKAELLEAGVMLDEMSPAEYAEACGAMTNKVADGSIRHRGQPEMNAAVAGLAARPAGDVETWSRRSSKVNIAPFVAATCALGRVPDASAFDGAWFVDLDDLGD